MEGPRNETPPRYKYHAAEAKNRTNTDEDEAFGKRRLLHEWRIGRWWNGRGRIAVGAGEFGSTDDPIVGSRRKTRQIGG